MAIKWIQMMGVEHLFSKPSIWSLDLSLDMPTFSWIFQLCGQDKRYKSWKIWNLWASDLWGATMCYIVFWQLQLIVCRMAMCYRTLHQGRGKSLHDNFHRNGSLAIPVMYDVSMRRESYYESPWEITDANGIDGMAPNDSPSVSAVSSCQLCSKEGIKSVKDSLCTVNSATADAWSPQDKEAREFHSQLFQEWGFQNEFNRNR